MKVRYKRTKLGEIPEDWDLKKIQEIAQTNMGQSPKSSDCNDSGNGLPFFQGNADFGFKYPVCKSWTTTPIKTALPNDILMSVRAPVGSLNIANTKCCIGRGLCSITPNNSTNLFFLYYALLYSVPRLHSRQQGSTFTAINKSDLNTFLLPTPSFSEQNKIAEILSTVDNAIEKTDAIIKETQQLKKGLMEKLLTEGIGHTRFKETKIGRMPETWSLEPLGDLISITHGWAFKGKYFGQTGPILLTPGNFCEEGGLYFNHRNVKRYSGEFPKKYVLNDEDLVIVMTDLASICKILGNPAIIRHNETLLHNQRIGKIVFKTNMLNKDYLYYFFLTRRYKNIVKSTATGSTVKHTAPERIYKIKFPCPSYSEQCKIAEILNEVDTKIENEQFYKSELEQLKQGLLQVLLTGKVRVKMS